MNTPSSLSQTYFFLGILSYLFLFLSLIITGVLYLYRRYKQGKQHRKIKRKEKRYQVKQVEMYYLHLRLNERDLTHDQAIEKLKEAQILSEHGIRQFSLNYSFRDSVLNRSEIKEFPLGYEPDKQ